MKFSLLGLLGGTEGQLQQHRKTPSKRLSAAAPVAPVSPGKQSWKTQAHVWAFLTFPSCLPLSICLTHPLKLGCVYLEAWLCICCSRWFILVVFFFFFFCLDSRIGSISLCRAPCSECWAASAGTIWVPAQHSEAGILLGCQLPWIACSFVCQPRWNINQSVFALSLTCSNPCPLPSLQFQCTHVSLLSVLCLFSHPSVPTCQKTWLHLDRGAAFEPLSLFGF